jgi:hypothetical protein
MLLDFANAAIGRAERRPGGKLDLHLDHLVSQVINPAANAIPCFSVPHDLLHE